MAGAHPNATSSPQYQEIKQSLHAKILDEIDLESLNRLNEETARERLSQEIRDLLRREKTPLTQREREEMVVELLHEVFGLGPIESLLADATISDILVNGPYEVYVERQGLLHRTNITFKDEGHLMRIIERIVSRVGRRVDESSPMVDARLKDGSRVNVIIPPLSLDGPILSIRRFGVNPLTAADLVANDTMTIEMLELLKACVQGKLNILISGGTGAGKTTLLNVLSAYIPEAERIVTIEDAAELQLKQEHVVRLETRPPNIEGEGAVMQRQLVINALRMRPDRIIVGEVRGEEAIDMLQAMNTGHEGSMTTIHANSPRDALSRLETMVSMANFNLPERALRQQIASAIHAVVQISRLPDGARKLMSISEISGMEGNTVTMQELFVFERQGYDENNKVRGAFRSTGIRPKFGERLLAGGISLPSELFAADVFSRKA
ncbi:MAG: CpaF family protein [Acidobacteriota bacterium]|jgi:pilus assembly protein CpaF